jgi:hypothetical protein
MLENSGENTEQRPRKKLGRCFLRLSGTKAENGAEYKSETKSHRTEELQNDE